MFDRNENKKMKKCKIQDCIGKVSGEKIFVYPPGISIVLEGEIIDKNIIESILYYKENKLNLVGSLTGSINNFINVVDND